MKTVTINPGQHCGEMEANPVEILCREFASKPLAEADTVLFDLSSAGFFSLSCAAATAEAIRAFVAQGRHVAVSGPSGSTASYLARMNFHKLVGLKFSESFVRHDPRARFVPLCMIAEPDDPGKVADKMESVLNANISDIAPSTSNLVNYAFGEIMDNVLQHSETVAHGIAGAQYYPNLGYIELVVADAGKGIVASMADNPAYSGIPPKRLMAKAFEKEAGQYVGRSGFGGSKVSMGMGLNVAANVTMALNGRLWAVSHGYSVRITEKGTESTSGLCYPGTVVCMKLPLQPGKTILESSIFEGGRDEPLLWSATEGFYFESDSNGADGVLW